MKLHDVPMITRSAGRMKLEGQPLTEHQMIALADLSVGFLMTNVRHRHDVPMMGINHG